MIAWAVVLASAAAALPEGAARYRVEIAGEPVGVVDLSVRCAGEACHASWEARLRAPADAGGALLVRRIEVETDRDGRWRGGRLRVLEDGAARAAPGVAGAVPATVAEIALAALAPERGEACLDVFDEATGERGRACARRAGGAVEAEILGTRALVAPGPDGLPARVDLPAQGAAFVADAAGSPPGTPPRLHGTAVPGPRDPTGPLRFCGVDADPAPSPAPPALPPPRASGGSCREKAAAWVAAARAAGLPARVAVGVAWDGAAFVWHAWAEARVDGAWIPVDPSFGQAPARGPRFTLARHAPGDGAGRAEAGRRILSCWGRARVERR